MHWKMVRGLLKVQKRKIKKNRTFDGFNVEHPTNFKKRSKTIEGGRPFTVDGWEGSIYSQKLHGIGNSIDYEVAASKSKPKAKKFKKDCKHKINCLHNVQENHTEEVQRVVDGEKVDEFSLINEDWTRGTNKKFKKAYKHLRQRLQNVKESIAGEVQRAVDEEKVNEIYLADKDCTRKMKRKFKKDRKHKKQCLQDVKESNTEEVERVGGEEKVDEITFIDEDCTRGMKKWLLQYKESRPGLEVLQQRIDEFVTAHEEQHEQERKEREARAAEGGWTVVVHHKGRKKTTDAETGTVVGSVASAAVMDKMSKKKAKIALDFYRFQKREAKMNELMMLRSKFEQDKKRIHQLRAARKFRPY